MTTSAIDQILNEIENDRQKAKTKAETKREEILRALMSAGVKVVTIEFAGSGDSGSIDSIDVDFHDDAKQPSLSDDLEKLLEDFTYDYLAGTGVDWYNNEGGQGSIVFDLSQPPYTLGASIDVNYTETKNEHHAHEAL
jgi:hypothetical protein